MEQQSQSNQRMASAQDNRSFIDKYASGPQMSAGFGGMDQVGARSTLGAVNSYRSDDIRHQNQQQNQQGVTDHYKPPEKRTSGNPFNAEVQDQWDGETEGAKFHGMSEEQKQQYQNSNPDQWVDLDGDGVLEFDPDMPPYPSYKFFTETKWESETSGGYIGIIYVPITRTVDGWSMTLKFSMPISMLENWEYQPLKQSPVDGVTAVLNSEHWNGVREEGTQMRIRMMVEYERTPGMPPGLIPQPAVALLGTIWYPDGSHANYDEGNQNQAVSYSEGFAGLPKPEGASNTKSYVDHAAQANKPKEVAFNSANMFTSNQQVRAAISFQDPLKPVVQTTQATTTRKYSSNILAGINTGPTQAPLSGNLAGLSQVYAQNDAEKKAYDALQERIIELQRMVQSNVINNAFGQVRTTVETITTTTQATTRRELTACEKRKIAEEHKCKEASCFRHRCLADGHFSPSQCWPKVKLCWCVTIKGMKLNTTLRPITKFNPQNCQLTYDPTGIKASMSVNTATVISGSATIRIVLHAKSGSSVAKPTVAPVTTTTPATRPTVKYSEYSRHDWIKVINLSTMFYAAQESGTLRDDYPVRWRQSAHKNDGRQCGLDLEGGYYDSGDYMKYTFPLAWTMTILSWSALEHRNTLEELGLWEKYVHVIEHGTKWLMKANPEARTLVAVVGDPDIDHQSWGRPQDQYGPRPCMKVSRYAPGTDVAAEVAAALAAASKIISDERKAEMAWIKAKALYDFADKHRGLYSKVVKEVKGYYESDSYTDELAWGALWLYRASKLETDKLKYMNRAKSAYTQFQLNKRARTFSWDEKHAGVQLLLAELTYDKTYRAHVIAFCDHNMPHGGAKYTPGGLLFIEKWGVLRHALNIALICLRTSLLPGMDAIRTANYRNFAISQLDYILGAQGRSFLVGYGKNYPDRPHHRAASCSLVGECGWDAYKNDVPNPQVLLGALVGGPDEFDEFVNNRTDYVRNEVALDYNAAITSISALMLDLERGNVG